MSGKRALITGAAIGTLLVIALVAYWPIDPPSPHTPGLTEENIEKLNAGMKREDTLALLGRKPASVYDNRFLWETELRRVKVTFNEDGYAYWYSVTHFNEGGRWEAYDLEPTWFIKVQRWLRTWM